MTKMEISKRQNEEWGEFRKDILNPLYSACRDGEIKDAKLLADVIKICHEGERRAFDYGDGITDTSLQIAFDE